MRPDTSLVELEGPFTRETVPEMRTKLFQAARQGRTGDVEVDFSRVSCMDTAGVALLVEVMRCVSAKGGELRLKGLDENMRQVIHLACLDHFFEMEKTSNGKK